jgi:hypothetical protein
MNDKKTEGVVVETLHYRCDFFRQRPKAPVQCSFVATTADIADWSTVPKKAANDLRNFQRPEMPGHVEEIAEFFEKFDDNSSPSAIVLGFSRSVRTLDNDKKALDISKLENGAVVPGYIEIPRIQLPIMESIEQKRSVLKELIGLIPTMTASGEQK